jgi:hypothetical protein
MRLLESLLKAEQRIQRRIDRAFGKGAATTPLEIRREILDEVEDHIVSRGGKRIFPFDQIGIHLVAAEADKREILRAALEEDNSLATDIRQLLRESRCETLTNIGIALDFVQATDEVAASPERFHLDFVRTQNRKPRGIQGMPENEIRVLKGAAEQPVYKMEKERIQIGRMGELLDREGRVVRRNVVVFLDNGDDINATVGRAHATIYFSREKGEFRVFDEMSRYGTRIFRDGRPIEVPGGNVRGVRLRPGDEIYLGQACLRFEYRENEAEK